MITREAWYKEVQEGAGYHDLLKMWHRAMRAQDQPDEVQDRDPQLLNEDYKTDLLRELLTLHQKQGRPPEEAIQLLLPLDSDWDWQDIVSKIPPQLLPSVSFQVAFFIERWIDEDSSGVPGEGYVNQKGKLYGDSGDGGSPWTLSIPEFRQMLENQGWSGWGSPSHLLAGRALYDKVLPTLELDSQEGADPMLEAFSKDLFNYRNNLRHHWSYSEWYDESEDQMSEEYLNEWGGWITTLQIHPPPGDTGYFPLALQWVQELGAF